MTRPRPLRARRRDGVFYLSTFSKTFAPGLRVGWILAPHAVREKLVIASEAQILCPSAYAQAAVTTYLTTMPWREQLKIYREIYRERRDALLDALGDLMPAGTTWTRPDGGLFVWATLPDGLDSKAMLPRAIAARVAYVPGTGFYADGTGHGYMRLNFSFPLAGTDPGGGAAPRRRDGAGARDASGLRRRAGPGRPPRTGRRGRARSRLGMIRPMGTTSAESLRADSAVGHDSSGQRRDLRSVVLAGGLSYERDVSLRSGRRVLDALRAAGIDAELRDVDVTLLPALAADPPDAVVIALHGATGEDGSLRGVLDLCGVPYVGCDARASRRAWDKPSAKTVLREAGIPTPDWVALPHDRFSELGAVAVLDRIVDRLGLPLMVKPAQGGSGLGAAVVRDAAALPAAMVGCFAYDSTALVERYVPGIDIAVSVIDLGDGPQALPAVEIVPRNGVLRLRGPLHGRPHHLAHAGPARRAGGGRGGRDGARRTPGARPAGSLPGRPDRRRGRGTARARGQRLAGDDRDVAAPARGAGRRAGPRPGPGDDGGAGRRPGPLTVPAGRSRRPASPHAPRLAVLAVAALGGCQPSLRGVGAV